MGGEEEGWVVQEQEEEEKKRIRKAGLVRYHQLTHHTRRGEPDFRPHVEGQGRGSRLKQACVRVLAIRALPFWSLWTLTVMMSQPWPLLLPQSVLSMVGKLARQSPERGSTL